MAFRIRRNCNRNTMGRFAYAGLHHILKSALISEFKSTTSGAELHKMLSDGQERKYSRMRKFTQQKMQIN